MSRWTMLGLAGLLVVSGPASAQYIGIFMDSNASTCGAEVGPNPRVDLHVVAILGGSVTEISGAQFMIRGAPNTWTPQNVLWVPDVGTAISLGNPVFPTPMHPFTPGVNIAFSACQKSTTSTRVPLGRIVLLGPPTADNVRLLVTWFDLVPSDPSCPFITDCSSGKAKACVGGGEIVLNGPPPASCGTAVEERTWASVKRLYD